ncbi:MAG: hypothetical protein WAS73_11975 [Defluviicoccus sp.]
MSRTVIGAFIISPHAASRAQQRGLKRQAVELVIGLHDRVVAVGNGREAWSVSRQRCKALRAAGLPAAVIERLDRTILVVEPLTATVITVINGHDEADRRYRRGEQGRRKWAWKVAA